MFDQLRVLATPLREILNSCALAFDFPILDWIHETLGCKFMDIFMYIITLFGEAGLFWIVISVVLLFFPKTRKCGLTMGLALAMGLLICNIIAKPIIYRPRPQDLLAVKGLPFLFKIPDPLGILKLDDASFPSGHTIACFEASVAILMYNRKWGFGALALAFLVAFSRLYLYVHYPTDVLVSVVLGTVFAIIAYFALRKVNLPERKHKGKYEAA